jgi:two-component system cell cycle sensor histidine kinase/response regulator CckA
MGRFLVLFGRRSFSAVGIALGYMVVSAAWIIFSDRLLPPLLGHPTVATLTHVQTLKGILFIALSAGLLYVLIRFASRAVDASQKALTEIQSSYRQLFRNTGAVVFIADAETGSIVDANPAAERFYGWSRQEFLGMTVADIQVESEEELSAETEAAKAEQRNFLMLRHRLASGEVRHVVTDSTVIDAGDTRLKCILVHDITERRTLENQLRQAQKMEAVGQLTGGIAHDLNNILTVVLADADLIAQELPDLQPEVKRDLDDLHAAARRGASMIRKLLSFSRSASLSIVTADLGELVQSVIPTLHRLLPEHIEITARDFAAGLVRVDQVALEQIVLNLATNARDAMPKGGTLRLETGRTFLSATPAQPWIRAGTYAFLKVTDSGTGMDERTLAKIFEPFFTTKSSTEGSGLGMAMIYGLVKQHGGFVSVESAIGVGTKVSVYLPPAPEGDVARGNHEGRSLENQGGGETILLVEDEDALRRAGQRVLEKLGYAVLVAPDGQEALELLEAAGDKIDLIITDLIMPRIGGRALFESARTKRRNLKFLFTSGYAAVGPGEVPLLPDVPFIQKPWTFDELGRKVREVLDTGPR